MKNKLQTLLFTSFVLVLGSTSVQAKTAIVGDIILLGNVEKSGHRLMNDTSVFEGDSIRTAKSSGGILRVGQGRVEIGESSEIEVVRQNPLRIMIKSGSVGLNF